MSNISPDLKKDLSELLKEEGQYVKQLTEVATKAAGFHARLESIMKALETNPSEYSTKESKDIADKAEEKYSAELEDRMKDHATKKVEL